jgi:RsiW-degrading membrane proteinase PrsW (M82 family)
MLSKKDPLIITFLACLVALIAPLVLLPLEKILPYPFIIEEVFKALIIFLIIKTIDSKNQIKIVFLLTFLFALSENLFYLSNFITLGLTDIFLKRFLLTTVLHLLTSYIILFPAQKKLYFLPLGLILAILTHFLYNLFVVTLL